ncbi:MAG: FadR family transcriptional regulator [Ardenticatenaceae bacterium]|nr:FadR family transcriptional regulator [Ardenticatenaceae bacterium]
MQLTKLDSQFLNYLIEAQIAPGERVPTLQEIGQELGISVGKLREQLEVARNLGLVSVRPRVGIQREPLDFSKAILPSVLFSLGTGEASFLQFSQLRRAIETVLWPQAVVLLTDNDKTRLHQIVDQAWQKLRGQPIHVPNGEHRQFHLAIFSRLDNPFVQGLLASYWDAYEASELTRFASYQYWLDVWNYHEKIVDALCANEFDLGQQLLVEHFDLLPTT